MIRIRRLAGPALLVAALTAGSGCAAITERATPVTQNSVAPAKVSETTTSPSPTPSAPPGSASPTPDPTPSKTPSKKPSPTTSAKPAKPAAMLEKGDSGEKVRELQHRLRQIGWFSGSITGNYQSATVKGVAGFQEKRKYDATGEVDAKTWSKLTSMTKTPSSAEMHNKLVAGPAILKKGSSGEKVKDLQARLKQIGWFSGKVTNYYGSVTVSAVKGFQAKRQIPVTGEVDQRTLDRLRAMTRTPTSDEKNNRTTKARSTSKVSSAGLDARCKSGRAICISKRTSTLTWVVNGKPQLRMSVRFGSELTPTREGSFSIGWKSRNHVSTLYHTPMPYAMFFSGGQAVHYSSDFAARGYNGASHGCVNVRDLSGIKWLFDQTRVGDKVIVYR
jgi:peptidoglycan hydrolase-like protein with peptidoglycan-binding domain